MPMYGKVMLVRGRHMNLKSVVAPLLNLKV